jgi:hypothetical protein
MCASFLLNAKLLLSYLRRASRLLTKLGLIYYYIITPFSHSPQATGMPDRREGNYVQTHFAQPNRPNMAAVPDRSATRPRLSECPTGGRGTTSRHTLLNQTALIWQRSLTLQPLAPGYRNARPAGGELRREKCCITKTPNYGSKPCLPSSFLAAALACSVSGYSLIRRWYWRRASSVF